MTPYEKKGWFRLELPEGWVADESEEPLTFTPPRGDGMLQVTVQDPRPLKPGEKLDPALLLVAFLGQAGVTLGPAGARSHGAGGLDWAEAEWTEEAEDVGPVSWRGWIATNHDLFAFLTYACPAGQEEADRAELGSMLASFRLG